MLATCKGALGIVRELVKHKANLDVTDVSGRNFAVLCFAFFPTFTASFPSVKMSQLLCTCRSNMGKVPWIAPQQNRG